MNENPYQDLTDFGPVESAAMLGMLRDARAIVHRNAESFNEAAAILEHVGQMLRGVVLNGLNDYKSVICSLARKAPTIQHQRVELLFDTVRRARNDSVHSGNYIRHHALRLVDLLLVLEEGLSMSGKMAGDLMVQNPTKAELWQNIATARRAMLANSFSYLPAQDSNGIWKLLSDVSVVLHLKRAKTMKDRSVLLGRQLQKALEEGEIELTECSRFFQEMDIEDIRRDVTHLPVLIVEKEGNEKRLLGILTAFDLL